MRDVVGIRGLFVPALLGLCLAMAHGEPSSLLTPSFQNQAVVNLGDDPHAGEQSVACFISPDGYLLTTTDALYGLRAPRAFLSTGAIMPVTVVARDPIHRLAVLRGPLRNVPVLPLEWRALADTLVTALVPGDHQAGTLRQGDTPSGLFDWQQGGTSAPTPPGTPLVDQQGQVVALAISSTHAIAVEYGCQLLALHGIHYCSPLAQHPRDDMPMLVRAPISWRSLAWVVGPMVVAFVLLAGGYLAMLGWRRRHGGQLPDDDAPAYT